MDETKESESNQRFERDTGGSWLLATHEWCAFENHVSVPGMTATDADEEIVGVGDAYLQEESNVEKYSERPGKTGRVAE